MQQTGIRQSCISHIEQVRRIITQEQETAILADLNVSPQLSEELTTTVRHITDARKIEEIGWAKIYQGEAAAGKICPRHGAAIVNFMNC